MVVLAALEHPGHVSGRNLQRFPAVPLEVGVRTVVVGAAAETNSSRIPLFLTARQVVVVRTPGRFFIFIFAICSVPASVTLSGWKFVHPCPCSLHFCSFICSLTTRSMVLSMLLSIRFCFLFVHLFVDRF